MLNFLVIFQAYQWSMGKGKTVNKVQLLELHSEVLRTLVSNMDLGHRHILI